MQSFDMYIPADWAKNTYSTPFLHETKSPFLPRLEAVDVLHSRGHAVLNLEGIDRQAATHLRCKTYLEGEKIIST